MRQRATINDTNYIKSDEEKIRYFNLEQKVHKYANEAFREIVKYFEDWTDFSTHITDELLPLYCFDEMAEIVAAIECGQNYYAGGGFVSTVRKQAVIRIGIRATTDKLTAKLKRTIRHEIVHYCLWLKNRGHNDDDLDFWCYAYMLDAKPYEKMTKENQEKFEIVKNIYDTHIKDLNCKIKVYTVQELMNRVSQNEFENLENNVIGAIENLKQIFKC